EPVARSVARQEDDRESGDAAAAERRRRFAPGTFDGLLADVLQARQIVDAGPADDAKDCLCHTHPANRVELCQFCGGFGRTVPRHCERSEAIHRAASKIWIASSLRSSQ